MVKSGRLIEGLGRYPLGDGDGIGEPFCVHPYERRFIRGSFRRSPFVHQAAFSAARGSGKSGLAAMLGLDSIVPDGELHQPGGETVAIASSFAQASKAIFEPLLRSLEFMGVRDDYRIRDQQNLADCTHKETGARFRVLGSTYTKAHGLRFNLAIADEPAQWGPSGGRVAAALDTGLGKRKGAKIIYLGTRPRAPTHFYAELLDDSDPGVFALVYAADRDAGNPIPRPRWTQ